MNIKSALWILMAWSFSTRPLVAIVLSIHTCISSCLWVNILRQRKVVAILQTIFSKTFSCILPKLVLKDRINNMPAFVQIMAYYWLGDKPLSELMMAWFTEAYICHSASMCEGGWTVEGLVKHQLQDDTQNIYLLIHPAAKILVNISSKYYLLPAYILVQYRNSYFKSYPIQKSNALSNSSPSNYTEILSAAKHWLIYS